MLGDPSFEGCLKKRDPGHLYKGTPFFVALFGIPTAYGGVFFVLFKAVSRVGAQAIFPFKRLFLRKLREIARALFGNNNKGEGAV